MIHRFRSTIFVGIAVFVVLIVGVYVWFPFISRFLFGEQVWNPPDYSPDRRFRLEFWQICTFRSWLPTTPGNGSDNVDGFVKLVDADGKVIAEKYIVGLKFCEPRWLDHEVIFLGDNDAGWKLPK